jgi:hypothetical protein
MPRILLGQITRKLEVCRVYRESLMKSFSTAVEAPSLGRNPSVL